MDGFPGSAEPQFGESKPYPHKEWYSRGYLPHRDHPGLLQGITYHLGDSMPKEALDRMEEELRLVEDKKKESERRKKIEAWLDAEYGSCVLRDPRAAVVVVDTWRRFAGLRYDLIAWVVMPNHVHVLVRTYEGVELGKVVQSWKNYTGRKIREMGLGGAVGEEETSTRRTGVRRSQVDTCRTGVRRSQGCSQDESSHGFWQREYWDRFIRDDRHFYAAVNYIHQNPVKAGLAQCPEEWPWSSAKDFEENMEQAQ